MVFAVFLTKYHVQQALIHGNCDPVVLMAFIGTIDTVVMRIRPNQDHTALLNGIDTVFNLKYYITAEIDINLTFPVNMKLMVIECRISIQCGMDYRKIDLLHSWYNKQVGFHPFHLFDNYIIFSDKIIL